MEFFFNEKFQNMLESCTKIPNLFVLHQCLKSLCTWSSERSYERNLQNLTTIKSNKLRFKKVF